MTNAIVFGLGAAVMITISMLCSSRSIRMIGDRPVLAWVMLVGLVISLPWAMLDGIPPSLTTSDVALLALIGVLQVAGLLVSYAALHVGKVGIVGPIIATEGAIGAVIAAFMGERMAIAAVVMLAITVAGVVVAGAAVDPEPVVGERPVLAVALAVVSATCFGIQLYLIGRLSANLPVSWVVLPPRLVGVVVFAIPLAVTGRLVLTRRAAPLVVASGVAEVLVNSFLSLGSRTSIAVTDVLAAQYAVLGPIAAWLLFRERLGRQQIIGVALLVIGVTGLTLMR